MEIKIFLLQFHKKLEMNKGNDFFTHAFNVVFYEINDKEMKTFYVIMMNFLFSTKIFHTQMKRISQRDY